MDTRELSGLSFTCLEGCGFCCTFTPEVSAKEEAALRKRFPALPVVRDGDRSHLAFQGGCGSCVLLTARRCTAYDDRPAHCRYFPFHVHFGPEPEVLVNRTCRGVEARDGGDLSAEFEGQVLNVAPDGVRAEIGQDAAAVFAEFEALAREAGAWGDAAAAAEEILAAGPPMLAADALEALAGGPDGVAALLDDALDPFHSEDPVGRPFHLAADLRWLCFHGRDGSIAVDEMQEDGSLRFVSRLHAPATLPSLPDSVLEGLHRVLAHLVGRGVFRAQVYAIVDDLDYSVSVEDAARARVLALAVDLLVRADLLRQLGVPDGHLATEAWRFADSAFLDAPTIGAWL